MFAGGKDIVTINKNKHIVNILFEQVMMIHHRIHLYFPIFILESLVSIQSSQFFLLDHLKFIHNCFIFKSIVDQDLDNSFVLKMNNQILLLEMFYCQKDIFDLGIKFRVFIS